MSPIAIYQIHDTFGLTGRGLVLAGVILEGTFGVGDIIQFDFNGQPFEYIISDIDLAMRVAEGKPHVGIIINSPNEQEINDLRNWNPRQTIGKIYLKE